MEKNCEHKQTRVMTWPVNGTSEICETCLQTRFLNEAVTDWQSRGYSKLSDWYREGAKLQDLADGTKLIRVFSSHVADMRDIAVKLKGDEKYSAILLMGTLVQSFE